MDDLNIEFDPDCSTCGHRARRHPSKFVDPRKQRTNEYVCMVCGRAIGLHGTRTTRAEWSTGYCKLVPCQGVPCARRDKLTGKMYAFDWDPCEGQED